MLDPRPELVPPPAAVEPTLAAPGLFAWRGGDVLLLGERTGEHWVVARGWRHADRLSDVRRWFFADRRAFAGQIRRLARDATGDATAAQRAGSAAAAWAETQQDGR